MMVCRTMLQESLNKADSLKEISLCSESINSLDVWTTQQQLLSIYEQLLILDLEYALDKKVEQDLWNYCFKNYIAVLQNSVRDKKNNAQAKLTRFLESASGFYLSLLQRICSAFNLDLPFKRNDSHFGIMRQPKTACKVNQPKRNSCFYICQHCLVHLGDIARYRVLRFQAEAFYRQAVGLGPSSGHPYNQLALLEASRGDRLSTVFYYVRSIAVAHHFPAAITNLHNVLTKVLITTFDSEVSKLSPEEYETVFLRLHACLYTSHNITSAVADLETLSPALTPLIATQEISSWKLVQMGVISIFVYTQSADRSGEVQQILSEFLISYLTSLLVPLYTMSQEVLLDYFALPAIKVLLSWLKCEPCVVSRLNKPHLWRGVCKLLNELRASHSVVPASALNDALPEDYDLRGFQPLDPVINNLNFNNNQNLKNEANDDLEKRLRAFRIIKIGEWLANNLTWRSIFISESGVFELLPIATVNGGKLSPHNHKTGTSVKLEQPRPVRRQNVAMQSILRLSNGLSDNTEGIVEHTYPTIGSSDARWWPPGPTLQESPPPWTGPDIPNQEVGSGMYSLFSGGLDCQPVTSSSINANTNSVLKHQSLWSGPGPSPLERLLEQQKTQRNVHAPDT